MFSRLWLTVVLSFLFYVIYLPSCESSFLLHLICPWLNITWLCSRKLLQDFSQLSVL
uniref:Uncharacterized protein n=1 Tax=Trichobilharzia regenti TaxID=157069 RepID=A0AA85IXB3_TRIRE|nr:unnamed protein product [Trichobilharzia regenti]